MKNDKKKSYWFKRRRYGYGWVPTTWQGWLVFGILLAVILGGAWMIRDTPQNELTDEVVVYLVAVLVGVLALVFISIKKGPEPKWRWGRSDKDNPDEDF